jgi:hypothetical protein
LGQHRFFRQSLSDRLGHTEVDDLRHGDTVNLRHQDVRRFDVSVNDPALVGMLDALTDLDEQPEARDGRQVVLVAVRGDGEAIHVLHHEEWAPLVRGSGVVHAGDVGVAHQSQRLAFRLEAGYYLLGVHAHLDQFHRQFAPDRFLLLGSIDLSHTPFTQFLHEPIRTNLLEGQELRC